MYLASRLTWTDEENAHSNLGQNTDKIHQPSDMKILIDIPKYMHIPLLKITHKAHVKEKKLLISQA